LKIDATNRKTLALRKGQNLRSTSEEANAILRKELQAPC